MVFTMLDTREPLIEQDICEAEKPDEPQPYYDNPYYSRFVC